MASLGLLKYTETKMQTTCLHLILRWCITPKRHLEKPVKNALYMSKGGTKGFIIARIWKIWRFTCHTLLVSMETENKRFAERYLPNRSSSFNETLTVFLGDKQESFEWFVSKDVFYLFYFRCFPDNYCFNMVTALYQKYIKKLNHSDNSFYLQKSFLKVLTHL